MRKGEKLMKRSVLYLGILLFVLLTAQFVQMKSVAKYSFEWSRRSVPKTFQQKPELLDRSEFPFLGRDVILLIDTIVKSAQWIEVVQNPFYKDDIRFKSCKLEYSKSYNMVDLTSLKNFGNFEDSLAIGPFKLLSITADQFQDTIRKAHLADGFVSSLKDKVKPDWSEQLFFSPYLGPLLIVLFVFGFWIVDKLGSWLSLLLKLPKWIIISAPIILFLVYDLIRIGKIQYDGLQMRGLSWSPWLTAQLIAGFIFIPALFIFFKLKKKHFDTWKFEDGEAAKFIYIFLFLTIANYAYGYFGAQIFYHANPDTTAIQVWQTGQTPAFALLIATTNFLNNFRKRYSALKGKEKALGFAQKSDIESKALLTSLQSKVNPHFLYNSLNSIASLAKQDPAKTEKMTLALSKFYRYSTNRKDRIWSTIKEEIELIKNYLAIEKIRFGDQLIYEINCSDHLKKLAIPHFLLQPLVENAIKYGYSEAEECIHVKIDIGQTDSDLIMKIIDTGDPFTEDINLGYGLESVQQKLKLCFPDRHQIDFVSKPQKAIVITLNINK